MYQVYIDRIVTLLNNNAGVIATASPVIAYYLGMKTIKTVEKRKRKEFKRELEFLLLNEIFFNLDYISQIDVSFNKNLLLDDDNLYIPTKAPRTEVIERYVEYDFISSLEKDKRLETMNIYVQLKQLKKEYYLWRELIVRTPHIKQEKQIFEQLSLPMTELTTAVLHNMVNLWIKLVLEIGSKSEYGIMKDLNRLMKKEKRKGKWMTGFYKASNYYRDSNKDKYDIVICWTNDLVEDINKSVIEIKSLYQNKTVEEDIKI